MTIQDILRQLQVDILEIVGDEFAPKQENGSPERQRLLGLLAQITPLQIKAEADIKTLISETVGRL